MFPNAPSSDEEDENECSFDNISAASLLLSNSQIPQSNRQRVSLPMIDEGSFTNRILVQERQREQALHFLAMCWNISNHTEVKPQFVNITNVVTNHGPPRGFVENITPALVYVIVEGDLTCPTEIDALDDIMYRVFTSFISDAAAIMSVDTVDIALNTPFLGFSAFLSIQTKSREAADKVIELCNHQTLSAAISQDACISNVSSITCGIDSLNNLLPTVRIADIISVPATCQQRAKGGSCLKEVQRVNVRNWPVLHSCAQKFHKLCITLSDQSKSLIRFSSSNINQNAQNSKFQALQPYHFVVRIENLRAKMFYVVRSSVTRCQVQFLEGSLCVVPSRSDGRYSLFEKFRVDEHVHVYMAYSSESDMIQAMQYLSDAMKAIDENIVVGRIISPHFRFTYPLQCEVICEVHKTHRCATCSLFYSATFGSQRCSSTEESFWRSKNGESTHVQTMGKTKRGDNTGKQISVDKIHDSMQSLTSFMSTGVCDDSYLRIFAVSCVVVMTPTDFEKRRKKLLERFQECFNIEQRNIIIASPQILNTMPPSLLLEVKVVASSTLSFDELASNINLAGKLEKQGITLMFNAPRDHNYHLIRQGAGVAVAHGMSYAGAMKALTLSPVEVFGLGDRGHLAPGKIADLIIWDADPLEPSSMPEKVFINGKDIDLTTRMSRLTERYTKNKDKPNGYRD